jgi:GH25 family lysozyme M1 (1,4-beta-N-acetylmuramidase)
VDILNDVPVNPYDSDKFYTVNGVMRYDSADVKTHTGIDVSSYQQDIDWQKVKASGIEFAMIRLGYRGYSTGSMNLDELFEDNIKGALAAGLDVGVYFFSQAITVDEAIEEASFVLSYIEDYNITYPVVFDWEAIGNESARTYGLETETLCRCANAFCDIMETAGYNPMIYFTSYSGYVKYNLSKVLDCDFWYAHYSDTPSFYYDFQMWQYSDCGTVDGIEGPVRYEYLLCRLLKNRDGKHGTFCFR